ncbi:hypothetical protein [Candidatus Nitrotoga fabula]|uniref:hypothetical protein n=1 Tax=Candidatus Nitrotoga fabula TaxID=2182327 RepID=UPI001BB47343|nr:hypothetical protein [Candidatus Nitrotoga fabula]
MNNNRKSIEAREKLQPCVVSGMHFLQSDLNPRRISGIMYALARFGLHAWFMRKRIPVMAWTSSLEAVNRKRGRAVEGTGLENLYSGGTIAVKI